MGEAMMNIQEPEDAISWWKTALETLKENQKKDADPTK
jgi:hypothetical protein